MDKKGKPNGRIIYIDDEVEACGTIMEFFTLRGYDVEVAFDAQSGYGFIKDTHPDLIIMDLKMAGVSGADLLQRLRDEKVRIPVIVVTAFQEALSELRERRLAVDKFFIKPYSLEDLHSVVDDLVGAV